MQESQVRPIFGSSDVNPAIIWPSCAMHKRVGIELTINTIGIIVSIAIFRRAQSSD